MSLTATTPQRDLWQRVHDYMQRHPYTEHSQCPFKTEKLKRFYEEARTLDINFGQAAALDREFFGVQFPQYWMTSYGCPNVPGTGFMTMAPSVLQYHADVANRGHQLVLDNIEFGTY